MAEQIPLLTHGDLLAINGDGKGHFKQASVAVFRVLPCADLIPDPHPGPR